VTLTCSVDEVIQPLYRILHKTAEHP